MKNQLILTARILLLGASVFLFSYISETQWWMENCTRGGVGFNFRGLVWFSTGLVVTFLSALGIIARTPEDLFK